MLQPFHLSYRPRTLDSHTHSRWRLAAGLADNDDDVLHVSECVSQVITG